MDGEQKQQQNQKHGNVLFHCFIEHGGPAPQAANQIRGLRNGRPMASRDLVTGIACSPKVWVRGAELAGSILPCEWSVQLSVTLQIFGHRINQKKLKEHRLYRLESHHMNFQQRFSHFDLGSTFHFFSLLCVCISVTLSPKWFLSSLYLSRSRNYRTNSAV